MFEKHFTLEEANTLIPAVRELFRRVHELLDGKAGAATAQHENGHNGHNGHNGPNGHGHEVLDLTKGEKVDAANELLQSVAAKGIVIQDWRRGLIDFPTIRDGEEVFLCYELEDGAEIRYYHELDAGYAGRTEL